MHLSPALSARVGRRHGVATIEELLVDGVSRHVVRAEVRRGALVPVHRGVVRRTSSPATFLSACAAACLADDEAVIGGLSAARLWGLVSAPASDRPDDRPIVLVAHDRTPLVNGVVLRRTNVLPAGHVVGRDDGVRLTVPARTWFDCARDLSDDDFEGLTERVVDHLAPVPALWAAVRELDARGRPGLARVRRVLDARREWNKPVGSRLEQLLVDGLSRRGVGPLVRDHAIRLRNGTTIHADVADLDLRWAVEIDHVGWHGGRFDGGRRAARERAPATIGWRVERVTDAELGARRAAMLDALASRWRRRAAA